MARRGELNYPLFHWSPQQNRRSITRLGLVPGRRPVALSGLELPDGSPWAHDRAWRAPYVCLGPDPHLAGVYSWRMHGEPGQTWDLWQVWLDPGVDKIVRRRRELEWVRHVEHTDAGPVASWSEQLRLVEVRVGNRIPKRRVEWLGERVLRNVRGRPR